ncbi:MAG: CHASE domain-containing protein [Opitutae bacterium]
MSLVVLAILLALAGRGAAQTSPQTERSFLSAEERAWLDGHAAELCVASAANIPPFTFVESGVWQGVSADLIHLMEGKLGLKFHILAPQNLAAILAQAQQGGPGIVTSVTKTSERSQYLTFTQPYVLIPTVILVRANTELGRWPEAFAGKRVAVGNGYGIQKDLEQKFPRLQVVPVSDDLDGLRLLSLGEVDAVVTDVASASFFIERERITGLRVLDTFDFTYALSFAVRRDLPVLREILAKTLHAIPERDRQAVVSRWVQLEINPLALLRERYQPFLPLGLTILALLLGAGLVGWMIARRRQFTPGHLAVGSGLLAGGLLLTGVVGYYAKTDADHDVQQQFEFAVDKVRLNILARLNACAEVLRSSAALFDASEAVRRDDWRAFIQGLQLEQHLPGIQGVGFAQLIPRAQLAEHVQAIRREGFPEYQVWPAGDRETYSAIIYLGPFTSRNLRAFGYDMLSEPVRRAAMERARDEQACALSEKVRLVQETSQDVQAGTLMYFPVYRHGLPLATLAQRRAAITGWVYSPYRMTDLLRGALREREGGVKVPDVEIQVYDGEAMSPETLLFDSKAAGNHARVATTQVTRVTTLDFAGRRWTLRFTPLGGLVAAADYTLMRLIFFAGTSISVLLVWLALSLLGTRTDARRMAAQLTQEVRESEKRFAVMADAVPVLIWEAGTDKLCNYFNKPWLDFTGRTLAQEKGHGWVEGVHPDDLARRLEIYVSNFDARREFELEYRLRRHDGAYHWLLDHGVPRYQPDGSFAGYIGSCMDITEHKQAEVARQKISRELRSVLESSSDLIAMLDREYRYVLFNSAFHDECQRIFGHNFQPGDSLLTALAHLPADLAAAKAGWDRALGGEDFTVTREFGDTAWERQWYELHFSPIRDGAGKVISAVHIVRNITERRRWELALQTSEKQLAHAMDQAHLAHWEMDTATQTFTFNDRFYALYGTTAEREGGYQMPAEVYAREFLPPEEQHHVAESIAKLLTGKIAELELEHRIRRRDGQYRHIFVRVTVKRNATERIVGTRGISQDITARISLEQQLKVLLDKAGRDARAQGELLREVNHRVTNNLTSILGLFVREQKLLEPTARPLVQPVLDRLTQRIGGLLAAHRLLSSSSWAPVRVDQLAEKVLTAALSANPDRLSAQLQITPGPLEVSPRQASSVALVLNELVTNSIKHGHGTVKPLTIGLEAEFDGEFVTLCYRDNGPGFPAEVIAGRHRNVGLGLIRQLVTESLQGDLTLANEAGAMVRIRIRPEELQRT